MNNLTKNTKPAQNTVPIVKGKGIYFWDEQGKEYMDFASSTLNLLLGQCYPPVLETVIKQVHTLTYASSRFSTRAYLDAAAKIIEIAPEGFNNVNIKMCDGSDANETGVKIARKYTGKPCIISFNHGHTGQSTQTIQLRGYERDPKLLSGSKEDVIFINPPKCKKAGDYLDTIKELEEVIKNNNNIAGLLLDPIMVNAGVLVTDDTRNYLHEVNKLCEDNNIIFILDENQSYGWLDGYFATNYFGIRPDVITLGKGLAAGYPLAGVLVKNYLKDVLDYNEADFTNGGNPISCVAAYECVNTLLTKNFEINKKEKYIKEKIFKLIGNSNIPMETRGVGLIHCIQICGDDDFINNAQAEEIFNLCLEGGLFLRRYQNKLILKPSIIVEYLEIDKAFEIIMQSISKVKKNI